MDRFVAIVVCPILAYAIVIGVLWLSSAAVFFASCGLRIPTTGLPQAITIASMLIIPLILSILAARKWLKFCAERYGITKFGIAIHVVVVSFAVIATLVRFVQILPWG